MDIRVSHDNPQIQQLVHKFITLQQNKF
uniref:Uncharacterized protein n=1 Tax=Leersia perrieri TaxID=77586 RepID=A0A0D9WUU3_9ORYZ